MHRGRRRGGCRSAIPVASPLPADAGETYRPEARPSGKAGIVPCRSADAGIHGDGILPAPTDGGIGSGEEAIVRVLPVDLGAESKTAHHSV